jgi:hypothetical protein
MPASCVGYAERAATNPQHARPHEVQNQNVHSLLVNLNPDLFAFITMVIVAARTLGLLLSLTLGLTWNAARAIAQSRAAWFAIGSAATVLVLNALTK